jgi:hypothetical protein
LSLPSIQHVSVTDEHHRVFFFFNGYTALVGPGRYFGFLIYLRAVGLLGRVISSSQGLYLNTRQHKHRKTDIDTINIHAQDHGLRAIEDCSCLRPLGYRDRPSGVYLAEIYHTALKFLKFIFLNRLIML